MVLEIIGIFHISPNYYSELDENVGELVIFNTLHLMRALMRSMPKSTVLNVSYVQLAENNSCPGKVKQ